jgi:hypothetical protein
MESYHGKARETRTQEKREDDEREQAVPEFMGGIQSTKAHTWPGWQERVSTREMECNRRYEP